MTPVISDDDDSERIDSKVLFVRICRRRDKSTINGVEEEEKTYFSGLHICPRRSIQGNALKSASHV